MSEQKNKSKRKIGLLGGTFDPVHLGHVRMAEACKLQLALDEIWWIPASVPPHKTRQTTPYDTYDYYYQKTVERKLGIRFGFSTLTVNPHLLAHL